nr:reverse transcriptase domain-containing protein [Tanacetum cinerariifolium]
MADQCTMAELLRAPTEGYAEAIMVPPILAEHFELKHSLINMMTSDQFFGLEKDNPHDHIRWFNKIPSAWDRYKDLLRTCPHHGFTELHQLDTFYNALNPADQDSLNSIAGGNLLERRTQDVLTIIKNKSKQTSAVTTPMIAILKQYQATPPPASVKAVEEICVTCRVVVNYNYVNSGCRPPVVPLSEMEKIKKMNESNIKAMQTQINYVKNKLRNEMKTSVSNRTNELKNMMASFFQMNTTSTSGSRPLPSNTIANPKGELKVITTRSGLVLDGLSVPMPLPFINLVEDKRVKETLTNTELSEFTIKVPPPLVQKAKPPSQINYVDKGYWGEEDPFGAPHNLFEKETKLKGVILELKRRHLKKLLFATIRRIQQRGHRVSAPAHHKNTRNKSIPDPVYPLFTHTPYAQLVGLRKKNRLSLKNDMPPRNK